MQWRQKKVVNYLLHHIEPELFPEEPTDDAWFKGKELDLLCFALRVHQEAFLPTETHDMDTTIPALSAVINQQYRAIGAPFSQVPANEPERLLQGYFPVVGKTITCAVDTAAEKTVVDFDYAESIRVEKPLSVETDVIITVGGRESRVNSLASEFANAGVALPTRDVHWLDEQLQPKETADDTPPPAKKQRLSAGSDGSPGESAASQTSSNVLSAALRKRLQAKMTPPK